jgi:hypothetical protein
MLEEEYSFMFRLHQGGWHTGTGKRPQHRRFRADGWATLCNRAASICGEAEEPPKGLLGQPLQSILRSAVKSATLCLKAVIHGWRCDGPSLGPRADIRPARSKSCASP